MQRHSTENVIRVNISNLCNLKSPKNLTNCYIPIRSIPTSSIAWLTLMHLSSGAIVFNFSNLWQRSHALHYNNNIKHEFMICCITVFYKNIILNIVRQVLAVYFLLVSNEHKYSIITLTYSTTSSFMPFHT